MEWDDLVYDRPIIFSINDYENVDKNHTVSIKPIGNLKTKYKMLIFWSEHTTK